MEEEKMNVLSDKQMKFIITWVYNQSKSGLTLKQVKLNYDKDKEKLINLSM